MPQLSVCYITPTYWKDLERFLILRRSLALFSPDIPHLVYVDTEDLSLFRKHCRDDPARSRLELVATADILPREFERERRYWRDWRGWVTERIGWRLGLYRRFGGWKLQQLIKLEALAALPYDVGVFLDSDLFLCGPVGPDAFVTPDGAVRLLETPARSYADFGFEVGRQIIIGGWLGAPAENYCYIHQAPRFLKRTGERLLAHLAAQRGPNWRRRLFHEFLSEYNLLGWTVRALENYEGYVREPGGADDWTYNVFDPPDLEPQLAACRRERGARRFFLIQSNMQIPASTYRDTVLALLDELAAGRGALADAVPTQ
ncbi:MAG: DUF6492 family protein [Elioraea sp.]|nr:DUF6492 family protein [Elioraea sp.]MDW8445592.1 DUF6492 family protein [Acetobacteraceae bacterium]